MPTQWVAPVSRNRMHYNRLLTVAVSVAISAPALIGFAGVAGVAGVAGPTDRILLHKDGAPSGHTGGFDEETCRACHFDGELNDPRGWISLSGVPQMYVADSTYTIVVSVGREDLGRAGFSLSARFDNGSPAGTLAPSDSLVKLSLSDAAVPFVTHTGLRNRVVEDSASWNLFWQAPSDRSGPIIFNLAANAANGDDSEFGDLIYTHEQITQSRSERTDDE